MSVGRACQSGGL